MATTRDQRDIWLTSKKKSDATSFVILLNHKVTVLQIILCIFSKLIPYSFVIRSVRAKCSPDEITCIPPARVEADFGLCIIYGSK